MYRRLTERLDEELEEGEEEYEEFASLVGESEDEFSPYEFESDDSDDEARTPVALASFAAPVSVAEARTDQTGDVASSSTVPGRTTRSSRSASRGRGRGRSVTTAGRSRSRPVAGTRATDPSPFLWQKSVNGRTLRPFAEKHGPKRRLPKKSTKLEIFAKFFTATILQQIVDFTNLNADRKLAAAPIPSPASKMAAWTPVTLEDIKAFFGLTILMGILHLPSLDMYWQKKYWTTETPAFGKVMSRKRFTDIWKFLHFCDESNAPDPDDPLKDRLYKIRPLIEGIIPNFQSAYTPARDISIDESMIPFKGRLSFKQFMRAKRTRFGIKTWVLAESLTGYVSNFQIYTGKEQGRSETGLSSRVVFDLMTPFLDKGYHLYVDNFYTSASLFHDLFERCTYACGTLRINRKYSPKEISLPRNCNIGTSDWTMAGPILAQSWKDSKEVFFLSTIHNPEYEPHIPEANRRVKRRGGEVTCPPLLHDYNKNMGGVDLNDQMRKYYNMGRRSKTWYRRVFFYILEVAVHNSTVLYKHVDEEAKAVTTKAFRIELAEELIGSVRTDRYAPKRPSPGDDDVRLRKEMGHLPKHLSTRNTCVVCSKKFYLLPPASRPAEPRRVNTKCTVCNVNLCTNSNNCFHAYHTKKEFWR